MVVISLYNLQRSESRDKHREMKGKGKEVLGARETRLSRLKLPFPFFWNACHLGYIQLCFMKHKTSGYATRDYQRHLLLYNWRSSLMFVLRTTPGWKSDQADGENFQSYLISHSAFR